MTNYTTDTTTTADRPAHPADAPHVNAKTTTRGVFEDPVAYLGNLGIEVEVVTDAGLPMAA